MQVRARWRDAVRPSEHPGLLLATAYGTVVLSVPPFLLPAVAGHYGIGLGAAATTTAAQLAGFAVGSWAGGRFLLPRGRLLAIALATAAAANGAAALLPPFGLLVGLLVLSGVALGVVTWFTWTLVFGDESRMGRIAVVGPVIGLTTGPAAAFVVDRWDASGIFTTLAVGALVPIAFSRRSGHLEPGMIAARRAKSSRHSSASGARVVLLALGLLTFGGSSVFTYGVAIATDTTSLSLAAISISYSVNALAAIPSARWTGRRGSAGLWLIACAASAFAMAVGSNGVLFFAGMALWGFAFWMGVPGTYSLLSALSRAPGERAGDAQAVMAAGRVVGPLMGGIVLDHLGATTLGFVAGALMTAAGITVIVIGRRAEDRPVHSN